MALLHSSLLPNNLMHYISQSLIHLASDQIIKWTPDVEIIDLYGGQFNDPHQETIFFSIPLTPPSFRSETLEGLFELTRHPSRSLDFRTSLTRCCFRNKRYRESRTRSGVPRTRKRKPRLTGLLWLCEGIYGLINDEGIK